VRTILQHAWAEIEHDIQYKSARALPPALRRRLAALAGLLEIADREFQAIRDEHDSDRGTPKRVGPRRS
jgi:ppGpp synthetase/RelA/SpoT-type nucleotidyltranferase